MTRQPTSAWRVFTGPGGRLEIHSERWAEILLLAQRWGWKPTQLSMFYLATNVDVPDADARSLARVGQKILDAALTNPLAVYPVRVDMGVLSEVTEFCSAGGFRITAHPG